MGEFEDLVRKLEAEEFPEFSDRDNYFPPDRPWVYFSPSSHLRTDLLTENIIRDLRRNDKMVLSVGSGTAYLERFLVKYFGIKKEQITLSDKEKVMPKDFAQLNFNMYEK